MRAIGCNPINLGCVLVSSCSEIMAWLFPMQSKFILCIVGGVIIVAGTVPVVMSVIIGRSNQEFLTRAETARGEVTELLSDTMRGAPNRGQTETVIRPVVTYRDRQGNERKYYSPFGRWPPDYQVGESVEILVDPNNPKDVRLRKDIGHVEADLLWVGLSFASLGVIVVAVALIFVQQNHDALSN